MWAKKPSLDKICSHQHDRRVSFSQQDNSRAGYSSARRDSASSKHRLDESDHGHNGDSKRSRRDSPHGNGKGKQTLYDIPSREPSPPQHAVQHGSREKYARYTDEDREYLVKYANFRLAEDPNLKKTDISHELARKVGHSTRVFRLREMLMSRTGTPPQPSVMAVALVCSSTGTGPLHYILQRSTRSQRPLR